MVKEKTKSALTICELWLGMDFPNMMGTSIGPACTVEHRKTRSELDVADNHVSNLRRGLAFQWWSFQWRCLGFPWFPRGFLHGYAYGEQDGTIRPIFDTEKRAGTQEPFLNDKYYMELTGILQLCKWHCFVSGNYLKLCSLHLFSSLVATFVLSMQRALLGSCRWPYYLLNMTVEHVKAQ